MTRREMHIQPSILTWSGITSGVSACLRVRGVCSRGLRRNWTRLSSAVAFAICMAGVGARGAPTTDWNSTVSGALWDTTGNWSKGVPGIANPATFTDASGLTLVISLAGAAPTAKSLTFRGTDTFTFDNSNTFTIGSGGITNSEAGRMQTFNNAFTVSGNQTWSATSGSLTFNGDVGLGSSTLTVAGPNAVALSGAVTGTAASKITKSGTGTLTLGAASPSFLGSYTVSAGTLQTNISGALSGNALTVAATGTLSLNSTSQSVGAFSSSGLLDLGTGGSITLLNAATLAGTLSGTGTIILNSGSTLTLGTNFSDSGINIELNGGTLKLNGSTDTFGSLLVTGNSVVDFGNPLTSVLTVSGVTLSGSSQLSVTNWANTVDYFYSGTSTGTQGTAPENQIVFSGYSGNLTRWNAYTDGPGNGHQVGPVPEPKNYGVLFVGLTLLAIVVTHRRQAAEAP